MSISVRELYDVYCESGPVSAVLVSGDIQGGDSWIDRSRDWAILVQMPEVLRHIDLSWCPVAVMVNSMVADRTILEHLGDLNDRDRFPTRFQCVLVREFPDLLDIIDTTGWSWDRHWSLLLRKRPELLWQHGKVIMDAMYDSVTNPCNIRLPADFNYQEILDRNTVVNDVWDEMMIVHPAIYPDEQQRLKKNLVARRKRRLEKARAI